MESRSVGSRAATSWNCVHVKLCWHRCWCHCPVHCTNWWSMSGNCSFPVVGHHICILPLKSRQTRVSSCLGTIFLCIVIIINRMIDMKERIQSTNTQQQQPLSTTVNTTSTIILFETEKQPRIIIIMAGEEPLQPFKLTIHHHQRHCVLI